MMKKTFTKNTFIKNTFLGFLLTFTFIFADVGVKAAATPIHPSKPSTKPAVKPSYDRLNREGYNYNPYYNDDEIAQEKALAEEKAKNEALQKELDVQKQAEYKALREKNKAQYEKEMKKFENRESKRTSSTENSIIISDKPVK